MTAGKYNETVDNTHKDLKCFQEFLYRNLYKYEQYKYMRPKSNQPVRSFATTKTHKFDSVNDITLNQLKLRPIIDQRGTYIYNASKVNQSQKLTECYKSFFFSFSLTLKVLQTFYASINLTLYRSFMLFPAGRMNSKSKNKTY